MRRTIIASILGLSCLVCHGQTGLPVYDRLVAQREAFPLERVYVHTDAEDYLQGDRIWLKGYLMDEVAHTPVDSTLYLYAELFDKEGTLIRRVRILRRQGAFSGYLDIPEDMPSGEAFIRAYTRYMAAAPETAFTKRIAVGRDLVRDVASPRDNGGLTVKRRPHGFQLRYPSKDYQYLLVMRGGKIGFLGSVGRGRSLLIPDDVLPDSPLDFLVVDRKGNVLTDQEAVVPQEDHRLSVPISLDRPSYHVGETVSMSLKPSALHEGEVLDLSVSVTCRPLIRRHLPASVTDYVLGRTLGFDYSKPLKGTPVSGEKESTASLSGTVRTMLLGRPVKDARVCLVSPQAGVLDILPSGADGRFSFEGLDFPAGTEYLVKSTNQQGKDRYSLALDEIPYPAFTKPENLYATALDDTIHVVYADDDNPLGTIDLLPAAVSVTIDGPPPVGFNRNADYAVTLRKIEERGYTHLVDLLQEVPGVFIRQEFSDGISRPRAYIRAGVSIQGDVPAAIAVDGTILEGEYDLEVIPMPDIARVDIFKTGQTVLWGSQGGGGVISITTKAGNLDTEILQLGELSITKAVPLGYQPASSFENAPIYRNKRTAYWNPLLLSDTVSFPLGGTPGTYLVVVEGVSSDGRLVHEEVAFDVSQ